MNTRIFSFLPLRGAVILALAWIATPTAGRADTIVYNNINNIVGSQTNGGATSATGNTALLADDIVFLAGYTGFNATSFSLAVVNTSTTTAETATLTVEFFMPNAAGTGPGTLLSSLTSAPTSFPGSQNSLTTVSFSALGFAIPASGKIWAGFYFTGVSGNLATLNSLGVYNELNSATMGPTVGNSTSAYFAGTAPATTGSNPVGNPMTNPSNGQNFGIVIAVPEPSSVLLTLAGGAGLAGWIARRRKTGN